MNEQPLSSGQTPQPGPAPGPFSQPPGALPASIPQPEGGPASIPAPLEIIQTELGQGQALAATRDSGAGWFFWIAGLTLVNTVLLISGTDITFGLGLGITLIVDAISGEAIKQSPNIAAVVRIFELGFDFLAIGVTGLWGFLGRKGQNWALMTGMVLLALDTLLLIGLGLSGGAFIGILIHGWALFSIFAGWKAGKELAKLQAQQAQQAGSPWVAQPSP